MAIDLDDEILQDFLVEAGEILEKLGGQLVDLEQRPEDDDLLNSVFRGFHTIKGGASFVGLTALVELCHRAEDVFNILRNGERKIDAKLMDAMLPVTDILETMFENVRAGIDPEPADPALLQLLETYTQPVAESAPATADTASTQSGNDDITDAEFEAILDASQSSAATTAADSQNKKEVTSDEITDDEFEALLDDLQGTGKNKSATETASVAAPTPANSPASSPAASDEMSEDEFEALLDELNGKGSAPASAPASTASTPAKTVKPEKKAEAAKPAVKKEAKPETGKKDAPAAETSVRVDTKRLDIIMNMVGELVLVRNRLATFKATGLDDELSTALGSLDVVTTDLQLSVMKTRMQPVKKVFGRFPRVVRDLARNLKKEVNLVLEGEDTDLDKNLVEAIADPMVHLVRNAVDHGIEIPEIREAAGKPRQGTVVLSAKQEGDHILISIKDDGAGMDANVLRAIAVKKGVMDKESAARLDDNECYNLIFAPGFSTKTEISDVSGRGVGMDVVKSRIVQLNGAVEIDSQKGKGSVFNIKLPLTLAIMPTLMIVLGEQRFALPLMSVNEIFNLDLSKTNVVDGKEVILVRDKAVPLYYLRKWLVNGGAPDANPDLQHVVLITVGNQRVAFVVDQLVGQEEVVIKPLGAMLHGTKGVAGATITGDGRIALILDVPNMLNAYAGRH